MSVEQRLAEDFAALTNRMNADGFADRIVMRLRRTERLRLVAIAGAGVAGASVASAQLAPLTKAFGAIAESEAARFTASGDFANAAFSPALAALLMLALAAAATAFILPESR